MRGNGFALSDLHSIPTYSIVSPVAAVALRCRLVVSILAVQRSSGFCDARELKWDQNLCHTSRQVFGFARLLTDHKKGYWKHSYNRDRSC